MPAETKERDPTKRQFRQRLGGIYQGSCKRWLSLGKGWGMTGEDFMDIIQEIMVQLLERQHLFWEMEESQLQSYILISLKNRFFDRQKRRRTISLEEVTAIAADNLEELVLDRLEYEKLAEAVKRLTPQQQTYVYLRYYLNLSNEEISREMGVQESAVRMMKRRTVQRLQQLLSEKNDEKKGGKDDGGPARYR